MTLRVYRCSACKTPFHSAELASKCCVFKKSRARELAALDRIRQENRELARLDVLRKRQEIREGE